VWAEPFRTVLLIMLDSAFVPARSSARRWENIHWDKGLIFNPRGKSETPALRPATSASS